MLNVACRQKIKIGHRAKFRDKDKCFLQLLFPVRAILRCISTSGVVRARLLREILTNFAHAHILVMAWMGYARAWLKTLSSLLKQLRKESLKNIQAWTRFEPMTSAIPVQCSTNWAIKQTGSWSLCEFVIYPLRWWDESEYSCFEKGCPTEKH